MCVWGDHKGARRIRAGGKTRHPGVRSRFPSQASTGSPETEGGAGKASRQEEQPLPSGIPTLTSEECQRPNSLEPDPDDPIRPG